MASFLQQLRLLMWKNCLSVWRQPVWSLALIIWPLIIFIILAITRSKYPPEKQSACYVAPRNLPSTGFFPFLQTLLCDADSSCKNRSLQPQTRMMFSKGLNWSPEDANWMASFPLNREFFDKLGIGGGRSAEQRSSLNLLTQLADMHHIWTTMINADFQSLANITSIIDTLNHSVLIEQDVVNEMLVSADFLKKVLCNYTLPYVKKTGNSAVDFMGDSYMTFCLSNGPFLEACLYTMNQMFTRVVREYPVEVLNTSVLVMGVIAELQNKSVVWETLLDLPYLFLPGSLDEKVQLGIKLLENLNSILQIVQSGYPQANIPVTYLTPTINETIHFLQYIRYWPGKDVNISLQNVLSGQPHVSTSKEQGLLDTVVFPLDKALLLVDFNAFSSYVCMGLNGTGAPTEDSLNSLCANNGLLPVFKRIDRNKVAEQLFLVWSREVSRLDVCFAVLRVNNLLSLFLPGSEHITSTLTTAGTVLSDWLLAVTDSVLLSMNQTTREITFVDMTTAVLHTLREIPGWPSVQRALGVGVGIMEFVTDLLKTQTDSLAQFN
ncbi:ATP-binding cassette sub-family A member 12-like [Polyodon spathula]|uniref:ATP-binding cassette sub-family A member 12-like n=1 Tax=Polyodon spathula TaxID=7913 RepID=UPI001B7E295E|nr:ATP-binding cassette sub-family A member 12-like [Polyodon spathula]